MNAAKALKGAPVQVTMIDRRNFHLFQPLLYQVATGGLSPADISVSIRAVLHKQKNARVILGEVESIEVAERRLKLSDGEQVDYDTLVLATGARHSYFGHDDWAETAPGLKTVEDATKIRRRIFFAFEAAERASDPDQRAAWLTFAIVGGGPTGAELAGAIGELANATLKNNFRSFDPSDARILLFEGGPRVLPTYPAQLSSKAAAALQRLGVTVKTDTLVQSVLKDAVEVSAGGETERVQTRTVLWAAGVQSSHLGRGIADETGAEMTRAGQVIVGQDFTVPGHPEIFVIGDLASYSHETGSPLRGTADVATAEGKYAGKAILRRLTGKKPKPFKFRDLGMLAVIGRSAAVADLRFIRFSGRLAWWFWLLVHIMKLVGFQNRLMVIVQWGWSFLTRNKSARLITGPSPFDEREDR